MDHLHRAKVGIQALINEAEAKLNMAYRAMKDSEAKVYGLRQALDQVEKQIDEAKKAK